MIAHVGRGFSMRRNEVAPATLLFFYLFLIMGEIGKASCRGRGEISGVAVSFKKKKKERYGGNFVTNVRQSQDTSKKFPIGAGQASSQTPSRTAVGSSAHGAVCCRQDTRHDLRHL